jgi:hypothetical protein
MPAGPLMTTLISGRNMTDIYNKIEININEFICQMWVSVPAVSKCQPSHDQVLFNIEPKSSFLIGAIDRK